MHRQKAYEQLGSMHMCVQQAYACCLDAVMLLTCQHKEGFSLLQSNNIDIGCMHRQCKS